MTEKTGYKYSAKASQSLTTGTIGFEVTMYFDDPTELEGANKNRLVDMMENVETTFEKRGYKIASIEPTNLEKANTIMTKKMKAAEVKRIAEAEANL